MNHHYRQILNAVLLAVIAWGFCLPPTCYAGDIKSRMKARLPQIKELKASGAIGEDNRGYLVVLQGNNTAASVVQAENADRQLVYQAIAKQQNTTPALVGKRRAMQIAAKAAPGEWIQDTNSQWIQKE